jgi:allantoin racemase
MRIMVINPNSSQEMTEHIRSELEQVKRDDTEITVVANAGAPAAIESASDIAEAVPLLLKLVRQANEQQYDAIIIACFSDPGLEAAREQSAVLVMGIQETALHVATMLGHKYTILTPLTRRIPSKEQDVRRFKAESSLASVRALGMTVTDTEANPRLTNIRILEVARKAAEEDGAEVILLGCAGMTGYAKDVEKELGVVVLDPTSVTLKVCEALIDAGVRHSKRALYATP